MYRLVLLILVPLIGWSPSSTIAQNAIEPVALPGTELHQIQTEAGDIYDIYLAGIPPINPNSELEYPVIYLLDAGGSFLMTAQIYERMTWTNELPPAILVGIDQPSNSLYEALAIRYLDLTPTRDLEIEESLSARYGFEVKSGGADYFLSVLKNEIIPWVDARFNTTEERALVGSSLGGLYITHVLLTAPDTFTHYLIGSPSLWWDNEVMFERERAYSEQFTDLSARVFMSVGTLEGSRNRMLSNMLRMTETLSNRNYESLQLKSHIFQDETHLSVTAAAYSRGLRYLFGKP